MKKYNYIIVSLLACLLTTSCNDYFDQVPDDRLSLKEIFTTRDGALRYLSNVYTFLPDGPGRFTQDSSCPALLRIPLRFV